MASDSRYIIGIDLGTTNIAVFFVDTEQQPGQIQPFPVPQVVAAGEVDAEALLPSFCYLPGASELPAGALSLPWAKAPDYAVGRFARDQGAAVPGRLVSSAKSWLAHAGVDRRKPILPWGSDLGDQNRSPVAVTALYLDHIRHAWDRQFGRRRDKHGSRCLLAEQQLVVTVPASFDETARELTLEAARQAGFGDVTLLEEPLAAFYAWLEQHEDDWRDHLDPGEQVLIVDVGGGTTDFSFVELDGEGRLHRFAVGDHLLLGGDNIDMAIARHLEKGWGTSLDHAQWSVLCQLSRGAKETLLETDRDSVRVTLLSRGSSVIGGTREAQFTRATLTEILDEGFYPLPPADAPPPKRQAGIRQMGLPYAAEPAVTVHLLEFLRRAARLRGAAALLFPHRVLFNGGSMKAAPVRERLLAALAGWFPDRPATRPLAGADYSLAVAIGAAYYGRVRRGEGVKVRGGIARSYFIAAADTEGRHRRVCIIGRDTDENVAVTTPGEFHLHTNRKVQFTLFSSSTRLNDRPGAVVDADEDLALVAPLVSVLPFGKGEERAVEVAIVSRLTETGILEVGLEARDTDHRWPLKFDLRPRAEAEREIPTDIGTVVESRVLDTARGVIRAAFTEDSDRLPKLMNEIEDVIGLPRDEWSLPLLRDLADLLLELEDRRGVSPRHEVRWLNLAGYCLRPGLGDAADEWRCRQVWKLWFGGPRHPRHAQAAAEWWVFWRRLAPGLKSGHQETIGATLAKALMPKGRYQKKMREGEQAQREMWRCLGALEKVGPQRKAAAGRVLLDRVRQLEAPEFWVLARLGARVPFHAPADVVLPAAVAAEWLATLAAAAPAVAATERRPLLFAVSHLAAKSGDRQLDLPAAATERARQLLADAPPAWRARLDGPAEHADRDEDARRLGDSLPLGLVIATADNRS